MNSFDREYVQEYLSQSDPGLNKFVSDFSKDGYKGIMYITLMYSEVTEEPEEELRNMPYKELSEYLRKFHQLAHDSGWTICAMLGYEHFFWIHSFIAFHPKYGNIYGDFMDKVYAESEDSMNHFLDNHRPVYWDSWDI